MINSSRYFCFVWALLPYPSVWLPSEPDFPLHPLFEILWAFVQKEIGQAHWTTEQAFEVSLGYFWVRCSFRYGLLFRRGRNSGGSSYGGHISAMPGLIQDWCKAFDKLSAGGDPFTCYDIINEVNSGLKIEQYGRRFVLQEGWDLPITFRSPKDQTTLPPQGTRPISSYGVSYQGRTWFWAIFTLDRVPEKNLQFLSRSS